MFIERMKESFKMTTPIFSREILTLFKDYSTANVFRMIKKAEESGDLVKFSTGVYFMPEPTFFGQTTITADVYKRQGMRHPYIRHIYFLSVPAALLRRRRDSPMSVPARFHNLRIQSYSRSTGISHRVHPRLIRFRIARQMCIRDSFSTIH